MACTAKRYEIALFLINIERDRVQKEKEEERKGRQVAAGRGSLPCYNMKNRGGRRPVFFTSYATILRARLHIHFGQVEPPIRCNQQKVKNGCIICSSGISGKLALATAT